MALLSASLVGARGLTLGLATLGLVMVVPGIAAAKEKPQARDRGWLALGGGMSGLILCLALLFPGVLNSYWAIDFAVDQPEQDLLVAAPREEPKGEGKTLGADDGADAAREVIRHNELLVSVESVRAGPLADKGQASYGLVHLQFANIGSAPIAFTGFEKGKRQPALTDTSGRAYAFLEQRQRLRARGEPVFDAPKTGGVELFATGSQGYLLVFELPPGGLKTLKLEVPAQAWGRKGMYQFLISGPF
jgi:hypothetical protein